ncbi:MAG: hypothetical protein ACI4VQ_06105 [Clostridia bacterium]
MSIKEHKIKKINFFITILTIIISINFIIPSFINKVYGEEDTEEQTSQIIKSQSETLRNIKFYRRSKQISKRRF